MQILIFGASGATGHELISQALREGYGITAFVRDPARLKIRHPDLNIVKGDVKDYDAVCNAVQPHYAVMSALGAKSPFKRVPILVQGIRHIVKAMEVKGAKRMVYLSFAGVRHSRHQLPFLFRTFMMPLLSNVAADHDEKEKAIRASALQWTIVRPVLLTNGGHTGTFQSGDELHPKLFNLLLSRADVADFMLQQLTDERYLKRAPVISH